MFAKTIIDSDAFLEMPLSSQSLYFHLSMRADDDGFINNPKKIQRMIGASDDDLKLLIAKSFLIPFESGIVVIKHWKIHNYIQSDRYKRTVYLEEKEMLDVKENKAYSLKNMECIQNGYKLETQVRLGKDSIGKDSIGESIEAKASTPTDQKHIFGEYKHVRLKDSEYEKLISEYGTEMTDSCITFLDEYIEMKGYKAKNHYLCIKKWVVDAVKERKGSKTNKVAEQLDESYAMMQKWAEEE
jgi:hypothetical protein